MFKDFRIALGALAFFLFATDVVAGPAYYQPTTDLTALAHYGTSSPYVLHAFVSSATINSVTGGASYTWAASCPGSPNGTTWVAATGVASGCWVLEGLATATPSSGGGSVNCSGLPALTGDVTTPGGSCATTLKNSGVTAATYGDATHSSQVVVDVNGRIVSAANVAIVGVPGTEPSIIAMLNVPANPGWDPQFVGIPGDVTLSNSNKTATPTSSSPYNHMMGTIARYTGKYYFEVTSASSSFASFGVTGVAGHVKRGNGNIFGAATYTGQIGLQPSGQVASNPSALSSSSGTIATVAGWTANDVISVAVDIDNNLIWFRTNAGNWNNSGSANPATGAGGIDLSFAWSESANRLLWPGGSCGCIAAITLREKTADFTQSVPSGYLSWSGL